MLNQLIDQFKSQAANQIAERFNLPIDTAGKTAEAAGESVANALNKQSGNFDLSDLMNLFSEGASNPKAETIQQTASNDFLAQLTGKLGIDSSKAAQIQEAVIPMVISFISSKMGKNGDALKGLLGGDAGKLLGDFGAKMGGLGGLFGK